MRKRVQILMIAGLGLLTGLAGCGGYERDIRLRDMRTTASGPDEFGVLPGKPLQEPPSFSDLPAPTPGQANLTDQNPLGDGVAALGGKPSRLVPGGVPAGDSALVRHASRNGVNPGIREELAASDEEFRRRKSRFTKVRIAPQDLYNKVYKRETLNPRREQARYRSVGVRTPTSPPSN